MSADGEKTKSQELSVLELSARMQAHAETEEWGEVEEIALQLRDAILAVPEVDRRAVLIALQDMTRQISCAARSAREHVGGRLSALRRGQIATEAYKQR